MTVLITVTTALLFGLLPALRSTRVDLAESFKDGDRASSEGRGKHRVRSALVVSEFALALVLLIGAGLLIRTFSALQRIDPGFDPRNVVTMTISVAGTAEADSSRRRPFFVDALARARSIPGVVGASYINHLPIDGDQWGFSFFVEGRPRPRPGEAPGAVYRVVFPTYFRTMGIPLLRGRDVTDTDRAGSPPVVVINDYLAKTYWPGQDPIGKRISFDDTTWMTVVGVTKNTTIHEWSAPPQEELFVPYAQSPASRFGYLTLVARVGCARAAPCDVTQFAAPIVNGIRDIDRNVAISSIESMRHAVDHATAEPRFYLVLLGAFAAIALVQCGGARGELSPGAARDTDRPIDRASARLAAVVRAMEYWRSAS